MRIVLFLCALSLLGGCFAIVNEDDTIQAFGIHSADVRDILKRVDEKPDSEKSEYLLFEKRSQE